MGSLIRLNDARARLFLNYQENEHSGIYSGLRGHGVGLHSNRAEFMTGKSAGELAGPCLSPNMQYLISFGTISPTKYEVSTSLNPQLLHKTHVTMVSMYSPGDTYEVCALLRPFVTLDLEAYEWLISLYLVD